MSERLSNAAMASCEIPPFGYLRNQHGTGIVHLGVGAFHKAHQATYTDAALASAGGDWRIIGISLRNPDAANALNPQDGLYTVLERGAEETTSRVIGAISHVIDATQNREAMMEALCAASTKIVSLTVTEKAYYIDRTTGGIDPSAPPNAHDLANPDNPTGVIGILTAALRNRRKANLPAFTVLCCDNLPENGKFLRGGVINFAQRLDPQLARWITDHVAFPSTMVDRITPASSSRTYVDAKRLSGFEDRAAVECEPFSQWVIEDHFPQGRPDWEAGGAIITQDVSAYENMKLRMLNGAHSMIAYAGFCAGHKYVRDVMASNVLAERVSAHLRAAASTITPLPEMDLAGYAEELAERFHNPNIAHETYQIAMDGTQKLPQRIFAPATHALNNEQDIKPFAFATAAWMAYCAGEGYALRDPREVELRAALIDQNSAAEIANALHNLTNLIPSGLNKSKIWRDTVVEELNLLLS